MSLTLAQLIKQLEGFREPVVSGDGRFSPEFQRLLIGIASQSNSTVATAQTAADNAQASANSAQTSANTAQTAANTAQTTADAAENTSAYIVPSPRQVIWFGDTVPLGDPTRDITFTVKDKDDVTVATRVLRGTLTTSAGTIAVTSVSSSGLTTAFVLTNDGTANVRAEVTVTFADGSKRTKEGGWLYIDTSSVSEVYY